VSTDRLTKTYLELEIPAKHQALLYTASIKVFTLGSVRHSVLNLNTLTIKGVTIVVYLGSLFASSTNF